MDLIILHNKSSDEMLIGIFLVCLRGLSKLHQIRKTVKKRQVKLTAVQAHTLFSCFTSPSTLQLKLAENNKPDLHPLHLRFVPKNKH